MSGNDERPLRLPKAPVPRLSPQGTPERLPYPILSRLSSPSHSRGTHRCAAGWRRENAFGMSEFGRRSYTYSIPSNDSPSVLS